MAPKKKEKVEVKNKEVAKTTRQKKTKNSSVKSEAVVVETNLPEKAKVSKTFSYERLSASMMKTWLQCKRKFYMNYVLGYKSEQTQPLSLGTACHEALEKANLYLKGKPKDLSAVEIEYYIQVFRDVLATQHVDSLETFEVGEGMVRQELSKNSKEKVIGIEEEFDIVTPEGVRIYGFIDKLVEKDSNTLKIIDYKTSKMPLSYEEARSDEQIAMYDLAMSIKYPQYENRILELRYLRGESSVTITKTEIEQQNFRRTLFSVDKAIKEFLKITKDLPEGSLNQFCNWCSYKSGCPSYIDRMNITLPGFPSIGQLTDSTFVDMWQKVVTIESSAKSWKDTLKQWALQRIEQDPESPISNGDKLIYTTSSTRRSYDPGVVSKILDMDALLGKNNPSGKPIISINNSALEEYLSNRNDGKLYEKVEKGVTVKFNSPSIRIKKA